MSARDLAAIRAWWLSDAPSGPRSWMPRKFVEVLWAEIEQADAERIRAESERDLLAAALTEWSTS